jgi:hypothetical protein
MLLGMRGINEAWGNVQTSYQRRNDLIGNLVNTVKELLILKKYFDRRYWRELKPLQ